MSAKALASMLLLCLFCKPIVGQNPGVFHETLDINEAHIRVYNTPDIGWDLYSSPKYEVPAGSGLHGSTGSAFWIGGLDLSTNLHFAGQLGRNDGVDFFPGPYRTTGNYEDGVSFEPSFQVDAIVGLSNGRVIFMGDMEMEEYDPVTGNSRTYSYAAIRPYPGLLELPNGKLLLYGDGGFPNIRPLVEIDQATFNGVVVDSLSQWHGPGQVELLNNGKVLFAGFFGCGLYDPISQSTSVAASMIQGRLRGASVLLSNGNVLVSGGGTNINVTAGLISMEIYDPIQDSWMAAPDMSGGRYDHSMIEMMNGEVLIAGGNFFNRTYDHFDPVSGTLTTPGVFNSFFKESTMTNQPNGKVLIVCEDYQWNPSGNFFQYDPVAGVEEDGKASGVLEAGGVMGNGNLIVPFSDGFYREISAETSALSGQKWQKVWKVSQDEIDLFIQDFQNGTVDFDNYPVILDWPAHGSVADGEDYYMAPFVDVDQDSLYDPAGDGDYPCIEGDQAIWFVFNDDAGPHDGSGGTKLGIQVKAMAYAYKCDSACPVLWLDHANFFHYEITNKSFTAYNNTYVSLFENIELGNFSDDLIGSDSTLGLSFSYNGDPDDESYMTYPVQTPSIPTDVIGYGENPPAVGNLSLDGPAGDKFTHVMTFENTFGGFGFPDTPEKYYNVQRAIFPNGTHLTVGGEGQSGTVPTNFVFSGDPGFCGTLPTGWNGSIPLNSYIKRFMVQSNGPFDLGAGETVNFDFAKIYARSYNNENLASVCELKAAASQIRPFFRDIDKNCLNLSVGREDKTDALLEGSIGLFPNPANHEVTIELKEGLKKIGEVRIFNQFGQVVLTTQIRTGQKLLTVDTSDLPNGVFVVQISSNGASMAKKFTVQH